MNILNLYAGLGGNRKLWEGHEITSVEYDPHILEAYRTLYPHDDAFLWDAHDYLREKYYLFDFIWSSPPCQSHGQYRYNVGVRAKRYEPLIKPTAVLGRHYFWANFDIPYVKCNKSSIRDKNKISDFDLDISGAKIKNKRQALRNMVDPELGKYILDCSEVWNY